MPVLDTVSQFEPLKRVLVAPTVAPVGTPVTCRVWLAGAGPPTGWLKVSEAGETVIVEDATVSCTGMV